MSSWSTFTTPAAQPSSVERSTRPSSTRSPRQLADPEAFQALKARLESDPRLTVEVRPERQFYEEQSELLSNFITVLGLTLSIAFSIGAMITMYTAVASRVRQIGALRALGFRRSSILAAFLLEALGLSPIGWGVGLALAAAMQLVQISTLNCLSFSERAFRFTLTPQIPLLSLAFARAMGLAGGFLPAVRAARLGIVDALRTAGGGRPLLGSSASVTRCGDLV